MLLLILVWRINSIHLYFFRQNLIVLVFLQGSVDSCDTKETSDDDEIDVSEITEEITKQVSH